MLHWILYWVTTHIHSGAFGSMLACSAVTWWNYSGTWMYFAKDWSPRCRILTRYYFWILKAATWNHAQYWISSLWILITERLQQTYSGILVLFKLLTSVVILCLSTRGIKLVLQIDVHATWIGGQQLPLIVIQLIVAMPIFSLFIKSWISRDSTEYYPAGNMLVIFCRYSAAIFHKNTAEVSYYL